MVVMCLEMFGPRCRVGLNYAYIIEKNDVAHRFLTLDAQPNDRIVRGQVWS